MRVVVTSISFSMFWRCSGVKSFESKLCNNLFMAGEVLNIDAITGGFNFQNAWTGGYLIAQYLF